MKLWMIAAMTLTLNSVAFAKDFNKVIYGNDDRLDVVDSADAMFVELSRSTAAMLRSSALYTSDETVEIVGQTLGERGICSDEPFVNQITAASCSGFLVGEDLLVTAGHCIKSMSDCRSNKWVFDYKQSADKGSFVISRDKVYSCVEVIDTKLDRLTQDDYALIRLDRKVTDRAPLTFRKTGKIAENTPLVVIGHPSGLPTKIADGANVRNNTNSVYFTANLDTYGGNSGSAVFNAETGEVEGILVRGEQDYVYDNSRWCRVSNHCTDDGCRGEDVTRITNIPALMEMASSLDSDNLLADAIGAVSGK